MYKDNLIVHVEASIHVGNLNIRHLKPKLDDVNVFFDNENNLDIFFVSGRHS